MLKILMAEQKDRQSWGELYKQYLGFYKTSLSEEQLQRVWAWFFDDENRIYCYLAKLDNRVIGLVHFREFFMPLKASLGIYLDDLFVDENHRGRGVAQKLIKFVEQFASQRHISELSWMTAPDNRQAMRVYDKLAKKTDWVTYELKVMP